MSRPTDLDFSGMPTDVAIYVATHDLPTDAANATIDFVRGVRDDLPGGLAALRMSMETWRGEFLGCHVRELVGGDRAEVPTRELKRLRATYGYDERGDFRDNAADVFIDAYSKTVNEKAVR